jgi:putative membrane protein
MLVFRNQTAHARFWDGRLHFNTVTTSVRNLSRQILVLSPAPLAPRRQSDPETSPISDQNQEEVLTKPDLQRVSSRSDPVLQNLGLKCHSSSHDQQRISDDSKASLKEISEQISAERKKRFRIREVETAKVKETLKILIAIMYAMKSHLRTDGGVVLSSGTWLSDDRQMTSDVEYRDLLPDYLKSNEDKGLALVLQLVVFVEAFIALGVAK